MQTWRTLRKAWNSLHKTPVCASCPELTRGITWTFSPKQGINIRFISWDAWLFWVILIIFDGQYCRCWSYLGARGGRQTISLQTPDCTGSGVTVHELMHALGFVHEQSRADRDKYVTIMWSNIWKGKVAFDNLILKSQYAILSLTYSSAHKYRQAEEFWKV